LLACRTIVPPHVPAHRQVHKPDTQAAGQFPGLVGLCDGVMPIGADEYATRRDRARAQLRAYGMDALIVEAGESLVYFTGVRWGRSERPLLWVLPVDGAPTFIGPSFEESTLRERLGGAMLRMWHEHERAYAIVGAVLAEAKIGGPKLAVEPWTRMFVLEGLKRDIPTATVVDGGAVVRNCRMSKSPAELAILRRANEATKAALRAAADHTRDGMLEAEMAGLVRAALEAAGLVDPWALVLFGSNAAFPHGTHGALTLADGDLVLADVGASLHGYRSDITRTWPFGQITDLAKQVFDAVDAGADGGAGGDPAGAAVRGGRRGGAGGHRAGGVRAGRHLLHAPTRARHRARGARGPVPRARQPADPDGGDDDVERARGVHPGQARRARRGHRRGHEGRRRGVRPAGAEPRAAVRGVMLSAR
jgi:hypothetical protein